MKLQDKYTVQLLLGVSQHLLYQHYNNCNPYKLHPDHFYFPPEKPLRSSIVTSSHHKTPVRSTLDRTLLFQRG